MELHGKVAKIKKTKSIGLVPRELVQVTIDLGPSGADGYLILNSPSELSEGSNIIINIEPVENNEKNQRTMESH